MIKSNSNNLFFLDVKNNVSLSYSNLLKNFTSKDFVITDGNFDNAKDFLINFISALYYGFDIKINDLGVLNNKKNKIIKISKFKKADTISKIIEGVINSTKYYTSNLWNNWSTKKYYTFGF